MHNQGQNGTISGYGHVIYREKHVLNLILEIGRLDDVFDPRLSIIKDYIV